LANKL